MLRRQKHALSQSTTPFACTLQSTELGTFFLKQFRVKRYLVRHWCTVPHHWEHYTDKEGALHIIMTFIVAPLPYFFKACAALPQANSDAWGPTSYALVEWNNFVTLFRLSGHIGLPPPLLSSRKKYERKVFSGGINSFLKIRIRIRQVFLAFNRKNTNSIRPEFFSFQDTNTNPKNTKRIPGRILFVFFPGLTVWACLALPLFSTSLILWSYVAALSI